MVRTGMIKNNAVLASALYLSSTDGLNIMRNPALRIKAFDGSEIHLDKRKQIVKAIEIYSKKKIIK